MKWTAAQTTAKAAVGWQWFRDIETTVVSDETVVVQIVRQICNLRKTLTFHDDERADHRFLRETTPSSCRPGQREVQLTEQIVIEHSGALGCEQRYVLNNFLSVDCGQPLSG